MTLNEKRKDLIFELKNTAQTFISIVEGIENS